MALFEISGDNLQAIPLGRMLASQLGVAIEHATGRDVNTEQLGARVMQAIYAL
ncbi:hypothetical protein PQR08_29730 [Caballeronia jiangsuensis]|uniref:Uncharacterized protein n=1 Tax=Caballeronia jiangsuensis TaxID=1458357 RepID=A0ABW9CTW4_9BURK